METIIICFAATLGLYMAWNIGANDVANSMADAVGSKAMSIRNAVIAAGICEFAGAVLVGAQVTETVRKGIVDPAVLATLPGITPHDAAVIMVIGMSAALLVRGFLAEFFHPVRHAGIHDPFHCRSCCRIRPGGGRVGRRELGQDGTDRLVLVHFPDCRRHLAYLIFIYISKAILGQEKPTKAAIKHIPFIVFLLTARGYAGNDLQRV